MALRFFYYLVTLPTIVKKCYGCGDIWQKNFVSHHTTSWSSTWIGVWCTEMTIVYSTDFTNTYYHPNPAHVRRKNAVFDGRVLIDLGTYQSLDEDQREMLKEHGLVVNIVNSR